MNRNDLVNLPGGLIVKLVMALLVSVGASTGISAEEVNAGNSSSDVDANAKPGTMQLESAVVTGNRELPKVMSIVPWKKAQPGELAGRPSNSLLNELLQPVDREVFRRQLRYYAQLADKARVADEEAATAAENLAVASTMVKAEAIVGTEAEADADTHKD